MKMFVSRAKDNDLSEQVAYYQFNKFNDMKEEKFSWRKELKSFIITFALGFFMVIYAELDSFNLETFENGAYWGVVFGAIRAGLKGSIELIILLFRKILNK